MGEVDEARLRAQIPELLLRTQRQRNRATALLFRASDLVEQRLSGHPLGTEVAGMIRRLATMA